jgi:hypothetical protein
MYKLWKRLYEQHRVTEAQVIETTQLTETEKQLILNPII